MSEKTSKHSLLFRDGRLVIGGVLQVTELSDKQAVFKLEGSVLTVRGSGLNIIKLDKEQGAVELEVATLGSAVYRQGGVLKGLFR